MDKKTKLTKEELAKKWKEYYVWLQKVYPVEKFELQGKNNESLHFYHGFNSKPLEKKIF